MVPGQRGWHGCCGDSRGRRVLPSATGRSVFFSLFLTSLCLNIIFNSLIIVQFIFSMIFIISS